MAEMYQETYETFFRIYDNTEEEVPYNKEWENGAGYLDGAAYPTDLKLDPCKLVRTKGNADRHIVIFGMGEFGNLVFFKRYSKIEDTAIAFNDPMIFWGMMVEYGVEKKTYSLLQKLLTEEGRLELYNRVAKYATDGIKDKDASTSLWVRRLGKHGFNIEAMRAAVK